MNKTKYHQRPKGQNPKGVVPMKTALMLMIAVILSGCPKVDGTDGGTNEPMKICIPLGLESPTNLIAVEKNDVYAVQLTWTSHSTGDFVSWIEVDWSQDETQRTKFPKMQPGAYYSFQNKFTNGDVFRIPLVAKYNYDALKEVKFRIRDCQKDNNECCSDYTEFVSTPIGQPLYQVATNVTATEVPSKEGSSYRAIKFTWTDNSIGEHHYIAMTCSSDDCINDPSVTNQLIIGWSLDTGWNESVVDKLPPNTPMSVFVSPAQGYSTLNWSPPIHLTTSP